MTHWRMALAALGLALVTAATSRAAEDLPVVDGKKVVASVQGESITLDELARELASMRRDRAPGATADRSAELAVLARMINVLLIAQEAGRMGLDRLPEIRQVVESNARVTLREELVERVVKDVRADPKQVEAIYRASVREWKISAALFGKEEHAKSMAAELAAGKGFGELARAYLADGRVTKVEDGVVLRREAMDPAIGKAIAGLAVGASSSVISTKSGFVIAKLEDVRYPDSPEARATAERIAVTSARREAVTAFDQALKKKYVKVNRGVLESLDYDAPTPGIEALLKDRRVVAEVQGEAPVTVADLTQELRHHFYHGTAMAAERKKLNARKEQLLDGLLHRKVFRKEALRLRLDTTEAYTRKVKDYERAALFDAVVRKAVVPDVKLTEDQVKAYYAAHRSEYTTPEMMRIRSLVFADRKTAETTLESLRTGADFQWVAGRTAGQVDPGAKGVLTFAGKPLMTTELPEGVRKAIAGAKAGDVRLWASPQKHVYVLAVQQVVAAAPRPYEQVRREIARKVRDAAIREAVERYAEKLRALSDVRVYLKAS